MHSRAAGGGVRRVGVGPPDRAAAGQRRRADTGDRLVAALIGAEVVRALRRRRAACACPWPCAGACGDAPAGRWPRLEPEARAVIPVIHALHAVPRRARIARLPRQHGDRHRASAPPGGARVQRGAAGRGIRRVGVGPPHRTSAHALGRADAGEAFVAALIGAEIVGTLRRRLGRRRRGRCRRRRGLGQTLEAVGGTVAPVVRALHPVPRRSGIARTAGQHAQRDGTAALPGGSRVQGGAAGGGVGRVGVRPPHRAGARQLGRADAGQRLVAACIGVHVVRALRRLSRRRRLFRLGRRGGRRQRVLHPALGLGEGTGAQREDDSEAQNQQPDAQHLSLHP